MWFMLLCLASGATLAAVLYYRNSHDALPRKVSIILALIRFLAISFIAFLLLNPLVKRFTREKELPVVVIAFDNSESMLVHSKDTLADATKLRNTFKQLVSELSRNFEVETYSFGESVRDSVNLDFDEKETDISSLFTSLENRYAGRNTGAFVMLSDGIYNRGFNPVTLTDRINLPVYTIRWGDTTLKRDLILAEVNYNRIAYLGNNFPIEIVIKATKSKGQQTRLTVRNREKIFHNQPIEINSDNFVKIVQVNLNAEREGILDYDILLAPVEDEITQVNNRTRAFVEVLTSKKRVLLLGKKPHPDLGAMYNALQFNDMIESEVVLLNDFRGQPATYDLIILHQLPDDQRTAELLAQVVRERVPMLLIAGGNTRHEYISGVGAGPVLTPGRMQGQHNEVLPILNSGFALFSPSTDFTDQLGELPPLIVPFGRYDAQPGEQGLFFQRIGNVKTNYPLLSFNQLQGNRACFIAGEGIWKWRIYSYRNKKSHKPFDVFFNQIVQYLTAGDDKTRFRVNSRSYFRENENIIFTAELYDAAYNPVVEPDVSLNIKSKDDQTYTFTFSRRESLYTLDAGRLPVDEYRYTANTTLGDESFSASGRFVIAPVNIEATMTRADHSILSALSHHTGGLSVNIDNVQNIIDDITNREDIKPVSHLREKFTDLTSVYWLLGIILLFFTIEWFFRKWFGGY